MSRPTSPGPSGQPAPPVQPYYRDSALPQPPPPPSSNSHYRDANGLPLNYREPGERPLAPAPSSAGQPHVVVAPSSKSRGHPYAKPEKDYVVAYKELKLKVHDVEMENDRLYFKVLQAKRNIQRAKLERAILYERLGQLPASPIPAHATLPGTLGPHGELVHHVGRHEREHPFYPQHIQPAFTGASHASPQIVIEHQGQIPITHAQQVITINTSDGPALVVAGPDGRPVMEQGRYIFANDLHPGAPMPQTAPVQKRRGGRVSKEVREMKEREARLQREAQDAQDAALVMTDMRSMPAAAPPSTQQHQGGEPLSANSAGVPPPQSGSSSRSHSVQHQYADMDWERERLEREKGGDREKYPEHDRSPQRHHSGGHAPHIHGHSSHGHAHRVHGHSGSPFSPPRPSPSHMQHGTHRHHAHQRIGPGSYVMRDAPTPPPLAGEEPVLPPSTATRGEPGPTAASRSASGTPPT